MLLREQEKILEELLNYLQDKPIGSVEFIAFFDITQELISRQCKRLIRDPDSMIAIVQEIKLMLVERDIERNKALLPGYYQAREKIADLRAELEQSYYYCPSIESYDEKKLLAAFDLVTYKFSRIWDAVHEGKLPIELSTIVEDDGD